MNKKQIIIKLKNVLNKLLIIVKFILLPLFSLKFLYLILKSKLTNVINYNKESFLINEILNVKKVINDIMYNNFRILYNLFIMIYNFFNDHLIKPTVLISKNSKKAAINNFKLGKKMLKAGNLVDAKMRFLLANMFYSKSAINKYYIAYIYFLEGNFDKSLKYLNESLNLRNNTEYGKRLFTNIQKELKLFSS